MIIAYLVVVAGARLSTGRLADMIGRKPIWAAGRPALFTIGSALFGGAPSPGLLIAARALQGFGGAFILAISPAMLTSAFAPHERGRALGLNAVVVALGVSAGPTLGGLLTTSLSWRWIFFVNAPLGIIGFLATLLLDSRARRERVHFDLLGALLLAMGLMAITLGLSFGQEWGWSSPRLVGVVMGGVVALVALYLVEKRVAHPMLILSLLCNRVFLSANLSLVLSFLALFAVGFLLARAAIAALGITTSLVRGKERG